MYNNSNSNQMYFEAIMPGMTEEQALYILRQPYNSFPGEVVSKAVAIATNLQDRLLKPKP